MSLSLIWTTHFHFTSSKYEPTLMPNHHEYKDHIQRVFRYRFFLG